MLRMVFVFLVAATVAYSANAVAVLEITPLSDKIKLSIDEMRHLTDELRRQAVLALPSKDYSVLTRDNIIQLLPTDEKELECLEQSCTVDVGRAIGAEYVSQGRIGHFGGDLSLAIELYETMSGKLIGSIVMESPDAKGLMVAIREQAPGLFSRIAPGVSTTLNDRAMSNSTNSGIARKNNSQLSTLNSQQKQSNPSFIVALSLDLLGAAAIGFGVYKHVDSRRLYKDYKNDEDRPPPSFGNSALAEEYEEMKKGQYQKVRDAEKLRNIGYAVGGALLAGGIAVHVWF
jgi:hypothetical protein